MPDYVRDRIHNNNGRPLGSYHNVRVYSQQRPHSYLLPKKIISKFNPPKQQHQQRYHYPPSNPPNLKAGISSSTSSSCYVCNKSFPSSQFLYSHMMRSHPERGMKGVLPPQQAAPMMMSVIPSQSQTSQNERGMNGVLPPQQAPMMKSVVPSQLSQSSSERGINSVLQPPRAPISPMKSVDVPSQSGHGSPSASDSSDVTEPDYCDPVKLLSSSWGKKDRRGRTNNPCATCASNAAIARLQKPNETMEAIKSSSSLPSTSNTLIPDQQNPNLSSTSTTDNEISLIDHKMMKMTMMTKKYKCNVCNKEFDTGQALGGHKSSSACKAVRETKLLAPAAHDYHDPQIVGVSTTKKTMADVEVSCTKKTMDDDIEEGEIVEDGEITDEEGIQRISHKIFDFDLNELPPEE
ncbi:hypothetical protein ACLB2K_045713 [Fragaria x ananassa]